MTPATALRRRSEQALGFEHEELVVRRGPRSEVEIAVAIHSTALGPALGGLRMWSYPTCGGAIADVLGLARAMTLKAAAAGLDLGGGKAVVRVAGRPEGTLRAAILADVADVVDGLGGRYVTAEDVGTGPADMVEIRRGTRHVVGLPVEHGGTGDPSPWTAQGVLAAMRACLTHRFGHRSLEGRTVCVVGLGRVGSQLARRARASGARVIGTDIDPGRAELVELLDGAWVDPEEALGVKCDVLAPCALGGAITEANVRSLRCEVLCGSANTMLASDRVAELLDRRGITYAPDFVANAGGLIAVASEALGSGPDAPEAVAGIEGSIAGILEAARARGTTTVEAARALARARLDQAA